MVKKERIKVLKPNSFRRVSLSEGSGIEKQVMENMVHLQKINADMADKFDKLSRQVSDLLVLFEMAARSFSKQQIAPIVTERDKEFVEKIDKLLDQNKTIAKGLTLMDERVRERIYGPGDSQPQMPPMQQLRQFVPQPRIAQPVQMPQIPKQAQQESMQVKEISAPGDEGELSISSKPVGEPATNSNSENKEGNPSPPVSRPLPRF